jgi:hypothetical protein
MTRRVVWRIGGRLARLEPLSFAERVSSLASTLAARPAAPRPHGMPCVFLTGTTRTGRPRLCWRDRRFSRPRNPDIRRRGCRVVGERARITSIKAFTPSREHAGAWAQPRLVAENWALGQAGGRRQATRLASFRQNGRKRQAARGQATSRRCRNIILDTGNPPKAYRKQGPSRCCGGGASRRGLIGECCSRATPFNARN